MNTSTEKKVFVIINSYFIGDILLVNPLIQNIKRLYENSVVVMVTSEALQDIAKYQKGVDDVVIWDRKGNDKGFIGMLKFLWRMRKYKNIYAVFPVYGMDRPSMLAKMLNPKYILAMLQKGLIKRFLKSQYPIKYHPESAQFNHISLLSGITKEKLVNVPMIYNVPNVDTEYRFEKPYTVFCPTSTRKTKEIPIEVVAEIIEKLDEDVVLIGKGETIKEYSKYLNTKHFSNLIDLSNKTNILEASYIIKNAKGMISADTGFMHMACAVKTPVATIFYETDTGAFKPDGTIYSAKVIDQNQTADNIILKYNELLEQDKVLHK